MKIFLDPDVDRVVEFMLHNVSGVKLQSVARAISQLADLLWADVPQGSHFRPFEWRTGESISFEDANRSLQPADAKRRDRQRR